MSEMSEVDKKAVNEIFDECTRRGKVITKHKKRVKHLERMILDWALMFEDCGQQTSPGLIKEMRRTAEDDSWLYD